MMSPSVAWLAKYLARFLIVSAASWLSNSSSQRYCKLFGQESSSNKNHSSERFCLMFSS